MNSNAFDALIDLVDFDQKTISLQKNIEKFASQVIVAEKKKNNLDAEVERAKAIFHEIQKEVDLGELEIKTYDQQIKDKQKKLDEVSGQKEYFSYKKEIEQLQKKQNDAEQPLVDSWNRLEQVKQDYKKQEESYENNLKVILESIKEIETEVQNLKNELQEHLSKRDDKVSKVPKEWLEKYEVLGSRVPDPVVPVERGSCSACFYDITPQIMLELKSGKLLQCKGCYRFMYMKK